MPQNSLISTAEYIKFYGRTSKLLPRNSLGSENYEEGTPAILVLCL